MLCVKAVFAVNNRLTRTWCNPHAIPRRSYQLQLQLSGDIILDLFLGLHLLCNRPTAEGSRDIPLTAVPEIIEDVIPALRQTVLRHTVVRIFDIGWNVTYTEGRAGTEQGQQTA